MVRRARSRTQTAIFEPHVVASAALGVHRREWDECSASRSLPCGHEALRSSSQFAPTASRRPLKPATHAGKQPGSWWRPGGRIDCRSHPRSALHPRSRSGALGGKPPCLAGASGQLLVFGWLASPAAGSVLLAFSPPTILHCSYNTHFTSSVRGNLAMMVSGFYRLSVVIRSADAGVSSRTASLHDGHALDKRRRRYLH